LADGLSEDKIAGYFILFKEKKRLKLWTAILRKRICLV